MLRTGCAARVSNAYCAIYPIVRLYSGNDPRTDQLGAAERPDILVDQDGALFAACSVVVSKPCAGSAFAQTGHRAQISPKTGRSLQSGESDLTGPVCMLVDDWLGGGKPNRTNGSTVALSSRALSYVVACLRMFKWCPGAESNHRHEDFQSTALPLSYPGTRGPGEVPAGSRCSSGEPDGCPARIQVYLCCRIGNLGNLVSETQDAIEQGASGPSGPYSQKTEATEGIPSSPASSDHRSRVRRGVSLRVSLRRQCSRCP